jgi:hypothetical protein
MTQKPEASFTFECPMDTIVVEFNGSGYKIEMTDGTRDAFYVFSPAHVAKMNGLMGLPEDQNFIEALKVIVEAGREEEFRQTMMKEFETEYFWISGF